MEKIDFISILEKQIDEKCSVCGDLTEAGWRECGCEQEGFNNGLRKAIELFKEYIKNKK